jgi:hypothetical protein
MKHMFRGAQFSRCMASSNGIAICGSIICYNDIYIYIYIEVFKCSQGAHCIVGSVVMEWSAWEYVLCYPAQHHPDENAFWRQEQHRSETIKCNCEKCQCRLLIHCKDASQWSYHTSNCSCGSGTRAVEKLTLYRTKYETIPTKGLRSTSWRLANIHTTIGGPCFQTIVLYGWNFSTGYINTLWMSGVYMPFYGQMKHILQVRVFLMFTRVISWHGLILMLSANVIVKSTSGSVDWNCHGPWSATRRLTSQWCRDFLEATFCPGCLKMHP